MYLWVDVYNEAGTQRLGPGPLVSLTNASYKQALDRTGTWAVGFPGGDPQVLDLIQEERNLSLWVEEGGYRRNVFFGPIQKVSIKDSSSGPVMSVSGVDQLEELKRRSTLLKRAYTGDTVEDILDDLIGLTPGWTYSVEPEVSSLTYTKVFNGETVLKALQTLGADVGIHFRLSGSRTIEVGLFGDTSPLRVVQAGSVAEDVYSSPEIALVESITTKTKAEDLYNWVLPVTAISVADNERATLGNSTLSSPYPIKSMLGPDGSTLYYIEDTASQAVYGVRQVVKTFEGIEVSSGASASELEEAGNALYRAAVKDLQRSLTQAEYYKVNIQKVWTSPPKPGDKLRLFYRGEAPEEDTLRDRHYYIDVDGFYWLLDVQESWSNGSHTTTLQVSNVDIAEPDVVQKVANSLEQVNRINRS